MYDHIARTDSIQPNSSFVESIAYVNGCFKCNVVFPLKIRYRIRIGPRCFVLLCCLSLPYNSSDRLGSLTTYRHVAVYQRMFLPTSSIPNCITGLLYVTGFKLLEWRSVWLRDRNFETAPWNLSILEINLFWMSYQNKAWKHIKLCKDNIIFYADWKFVLFNCVKHKSRYCSISRRRTKSQK